MSSKLHTQRIQLEYDMLFEETHYFPIITFLEGSNGKKDHTIAIYKGLIFNGNFKNALHLSQEALDLCCSEDDQKALFVEFHWSYIFHHFEEYLFHHDQGNKIKNKKKKQADKKRQRKQRPDIKEKSQLNWKKKLRK